MKKLKNVIVVLVILLMCLNTQAQKIKMKTGNGNAAVLQTTKGDFRFSIDAVVDCPSNCTIWKLELPSSIKLSEYYFSTCDSTGEGGFGTTEDVSDYLYAWTYIDLPRKWYGFPRISKTNLKLTTTDGQEILFTIKIKHGYLMASVK